ncbi:VanW family protein [Amycolatopsis albispora]|uniref:Vanomycin resistance protein VanB n=1 Tax=Amycolatopsis albispora TaxID=1804986 RepID=A0A344LHN9_9PSEU|nr:VanW family protein [Amycolatopsis albispora]AXB47563.1 vanomycin resistance protein VanB [Amycolatopsis albispora]
MPQDSQWPGSRTEETDVFPAVSGQLTDPEQTDAFGTQTAFVHPIPPEEPDAGDDRKRKLKRGGLIAGAVLGAFVVLYGADLLINSGDVPRGVTVAGVDVGGMSRENAEQELRQQLEPRLNQPVRVRAGDVEHTLDPRETGLILDWPATLDRAGEQPLNPFARIASFFTTRETGLATNADQATLATAMDGLRAQVDRGPAEGTITFDGATPVPVDPKPGQALDVPAASQLLLSQWASGQVLELPVGLTPVKSTPESVRAALEQFAKPAVSGPVTVKGEGKDAKVPPEDIGKVITFEVAEDGALVPKIDNGKFAEAAGPQLASTEKEGRDAEIVFEGGKPTVHPSEDGKKINWEPTLVPLPEVLKQPQVREVKAVYENKPAKVTTEEANKLGIKEVIGEFTTKGFAADSGVNIRVVADKVNGAIVKPGDTFSLNGFTGPRTKAQGYVEAGVISDGAPGREVGGGISQFATTLYNAYYFAGMKDAGHKEHSYYISRYPPAREATVFQNHSGGSVIDLKFTNDSETGVAIQTVWTPSSITVKLWGTKRYNVESVPGERHSFTEPQEKQGPAENCQPSAGAQGFTVSDTRVLRDAATGREVKREPRNVRYNPQPKIVCPGT